MEQLRIRSHGRYGLEVKSRYILDDDSRGTEVHRGRGRKRQRYDVGMYLFFPYSFNVNPSTYRRDAFYDDLKLYLRFDTPGFSAGELLDESSETSPLVRCERMVDEAESNGGRIPFESFSYESKLLANVCKSLLRDWYSYLEDLIEEEDQDAGHRGVAEQASNGPEQDGHYGVNEKKLAGQVKRRWNIVRRFHRLVSRIESLEHESEAGGDGGAMILQHTRMIDEHLSLLLEKYFVLVLEESRRLDLKKAAKRVEKNILEEMWYRRGQGYPSVIEAGSSECELENYVYRVKMLKRYAAKVLFNTMKRRNSAKALEHVLYAGAAGIAMLFATSLAFLGQTAFGNLSLSLFVLLVASYMLKDRIKDLFRELFLKLFGNRFFDRSIRLLDPRYEKRLGRIRDHAHFDKERKVDATVLKLRNRAAFDRLAGDSGEESIFHYRKQIRLDAARLHAYHRRIRGFADITIINLEHFLRRLVAQRSRIPVIREDRKIDFASARRVYHLNVVFYYREKGGEKIFERRRLVVDGGGIRRIETVT